jgi:uncharacterized iron-regulated membrane protein
MPPRTPRTSPSLRTIVNIWSRRLHRWGSIAVMLPLLVVICTGLMLLLKKQVPWIQPPGADGMGGPPSVSFEAILAAARTVPEAAVSGWNDIDRLDIRVKDGVAKVHARNHWEVQVDTATGSILQHAYRRSDLIESLHDGSWFHPKAKLWVFLPNGLILLGLWLTGMYLWLLPHLARRRRAKASSAGTRHASVQAP